MKEFEPKTNIYYTAQGNSFTLIQAEILAIEQCTVEIKIRNLTRKQISIMSGSNLLKLKIVWECLHTLGDIATQNTNQLKVNLVYSVKSNLKSIQVINVLQNMK